MVIIKDINKSKVKLLANMLIKKDNKYLVLKCPKNSSYAPGMVEDI